MRNCFVFNFVLEQRKKCIAFKQSVYIAQQPIYGFFFAINLFDRSSYVYDNIPRFREQIWACLHVFSLFKRCNTHYLLYFNRYHIIEGDSKLEIIIE